MKKKLVAFAVTAAMIITSAVPVFAVEWGVEKPSEPSAPVENPNPNVVTVTGTQATYSVVGEITEKAKEFSQIIDLNAGNEAQKEYSFGLEILDKKGGAAADGTNLILTGTGAAGYAVRASDGFVADVAGDVKVKGIVKITWSVSTEEIQMSVYEYGTKKTVTYTKAINPAAKYINAFVANALGGELVMFNEYPENVEAVSVQVAQKDAKGNVVKDKEGNVQYEDTTQPVLNETLYVNGMTLTADTKIAKEDIEKYASVKWYRDDEEITSSTVDGANFPLQYTPGTEDKGHKITVKVEGLKTSGVFSGVVWGNNSEALARFTRYAGDNRYETAISNAEAVAKNTSGGLKGVVVASGVDYADALSGVALSAEYQYPMLLVNAEYENAVVDFINENLAYDGEIYILGGERAVSKDFENAVYKYEVNRLAGADRYATNLAVLKTMNDAGKIEVQADILVASGSAYADVLSAAATGNPVLLVSDALSDEQKTFLKGLGHNDQYFIIGGTAVVSEDVVTTLTSRDYVSAVKKDVKRVAGDDRYTTNLAVYKAFKDTAFKSNTIAYVVTGTGFADGLIAASNAAAYGPNPVVLVSADNVETANTIIKQVGVTENGKIFVYGGTAAVSEETVQKIVLKKTA